MSFFNENLDCIDPQLHLGAQSRHNERYLGLRGELILEAHEGGKLVHAYRHSNIIVNTASILIARLLKDNAEPTNGISYLAVGSGSGSWDLFDPPAPTTSQTRLENEFFRKALDLSTFVHPETGERFSGDLSFAGKGSSP